MPNVAYASRYIEGNGDERNVASVPGAARMGAVGVFARTIGPLPIPINMESKINLGIANTEA